MDMRQLRRQLEAHPDVTVVPGSKHVRVLASDTGAQIAVISRGAQSNKGRDAKNVLASLRRNGIDLEGGSVANVKSALASGATPARVGALRQDAEAVISLLGLSKTGLADSIFEMQDIVIVGGPKYKSRESLRETVYRLMRKGAKGGVSEWGADLIEAGIKHLVDEAAELASQEAEKITAEAHRYSDPELEGLRIVLEEATEAFRQHWNYEQTAAFPRGKGTFGRTADWAIAWAETEGRNLSEGKTHGDLKVKLAARIGRFVGASNAPVSATKDDIVWIVEKWEQVQGNADPFALPGRTPKLRQPEVVVPEVIVLPQEPQITHAWNGAEVTETAEVPTKTPLHIRMLISMMGMLPAGSDLEELRDLAVEIMQLEQGK